MPLPDKKQRHGKVMGALSLISVKTRSSPERTGSEPTEEYGNYTLKMIMSSQHNSVANRAHVIL